MVLYRHQNRLFSTHCFKLPPLNLLQRPLTPGLDAKGNETIKVKFKAAESEFGFQCNLPIKLLSSQTHFHHSTRYWLYDETLIGNAENFLFCRAPNAVLYHFSALPTRRAAIKPHHELCSHLVPSKCYTMCVSVAA